MNLRRSSVSGIRPRSLYVRSAPASSRAGRSSLNFFSRKVRTSSFVFDSTFGGVLNFSPTDFSIAGIAVATSFAYGPLPTGRSVGAAAGGRGGGARAGAAGGGGLSAPPRGRHQQGGGGPKEEGERRGGGPDTP